RHHRRGIPDAEAVYSGCGVSPDSGWPPGRPERRQERRVAALGWRSGQRQVLAARPDQRRQRQEPANRVAMEDRQLRAAARYQLRADAVDGWRRPLYNGWI